MLTNGLNSLAEKCQYEWRVAPVVCSYTISKRIETQLQEIEQKSEKKKLEVRALAVCHLFPPNVVTFFFQLVELQTELQQHQKPDGSGAPAASIP